MAKDGGKTSSGGKEDKAPSNKQKERELRRAAALRENLRKRKAQARARSAPRPAQGAAPEDEGDD